MSQRPRSFVAMSRLAKRSSAAKSTYRCQQCGHQERRWLGRCPQCQDWNSLIEEIASSPGLGRVSVAAQPGAPTPITEVAELDATERLMCNLDEVDRVLGGGLVHGSLVLLGGEPGIGKSTLLLQVLEGLAQHTSPKSVLYISGEESAAQTKLRARRVGAHASNLMVLPETNLERILEQATKLRPAAVAVDSIQTVHTSSLESIPGSVGQVRECASKLLTYAKSSNIPTIVVGHVTKEGAIAGPKTLEHVVDAVLYFEGDSGSSYRLLRAHKNRFGSTRELGVFEMLGEGLKQVPNPSELFLAERPIGAPGSVVVASAEGSRPLLVEVQALVAHPSAALGRRTATGVDVKRVAMILAVLAQHATTDVISQDIFVNVAGGLRLTEPATDLGVACAIASAARNVALDPHTILFGELGLAGEVRAVNLCQQRLDEAAKLGFQRCVLPEQNARQMRGHPLELLGVRTLEAALDQM